MAKIIGTISVALFITLLTGCQSNPERANRLAAAERNAPVCTHEKECEAMWASARRWLLDNSSTKLQHYSADFMETYNNRNTARTGYRVTKDPAGAGYKISLEAGCRNPFGCSPDPLQQMESFNRTVGRHHIATSVSPNKAQTHNTSNPEGEINNHGEQLGSMGSVSLIQLEQKKRYRYVWFFPIKNTT